MKYLAYLKWALLALVAMVLFILAAPICLWFVWRTKGIDNDYFKTTSINIDIFGNENFYPLWNFLWSKGGYSFGSKHETMSSVFGKKYLERSLNWFGLAMVFILTKKHCLNAIS
jgi:hypothetical protein